MWLHASLGDAIKRCRHLDAGGDWEEIENMQCRIWRGKKRLMVRTWWVVSSDEEVKNSQGEKKRGMKIQDITISDRNMSRFKTETSGCHIGS